MISSFIASHNKAKGLKLEQILANSAREMNTIFDKLSNKDDVTAHYAALQNVRESGREIADVHLAAIQSSLPNTTVALGTAINLMTKVSDIDIMIIAKDLIKGDKVDDAVLSPIKRELLKKNYKEGGTRGIPGKPGFWLIFSGFDFDRNVEIEIKVRDETSAGDIVTIHNNLAQLDEEKSAVIVYMKDALNAKEWTYAIFKYTMYEWMYHISNVKVKRLFGPPPGIRWRVGLLLENKDKERKWKELVWNVELQG